MPKFKRDFCEVCYRPIKVALDFDNSKEKAVCGHKCFLIENLFIMHYSDKAYEVRRYYAETSGKTLPKM